MRTRTLLVSLGILALIMSVGIAGVLAFVGIERVSIDSAGIQGDDDSYIPYAPTPTPDGRYVIFYSNASNLVPGDTNSATDVFVRDTVTDTTTRVSVDSAGNQGNSNSDLPSMSADGRYVAFQSLADNLVAGDTNTVYDVFLRDRVANTTTRVSVDSAGNQGNGISTDPRISADGRYVAFDSLATNLVPGDTNGTWDIFVRDTKTNTTTRVSVDSAGNQSNGESGLPAISDDGRYVAFYSLATNLVPGDSNGARDIFVRDRQMNTTIRVSVDSAGNQGNDESHIPSISGDGRFVAFHSWASNLVPGDTNGERDIFVRDIVANTTTRVSVDSAGNQSNGDSIFPSISSDGRFVVFQSAATNLVAGDTNLVVDIFLRDRVANTTTRLSTSAAGAQANGSSHAPTVSVGGHYVAFESNATNLVPGDTNGTQDVFLVQVSPVTTTASINTDGGIVNFRTSGGYINRLRAVSPADTQCAASGYTFPYGLFSFDFAPFLLGQEVRVTIRFPGLLPADAVFFVCRNGNAIDMSQDMTRPDDNTAVLALNGVGLTGTGGFGLPSHEKSTSHGASMPTTPQGPVSLPSISVKSASLSAAKVAPGAPVTVTASVANGSVVNGTARITLYVNGQEESSQGVTVNSGSNTPVTFSVSRSEPGTYAVYVGGTNAGSFTVDAFADPGMVGLGIGILCIVVFAAAVIIYRRRSQPSRQA